MNLVGNAKKSERGVWRRGLAAKNGRQNQVLGGQFGCGGASLLTAGLSVMRESIAIF
jgi:hypothetical protein